MYRYYHTVTIIITDYYLILPALLEIPAFIYASQSCMVVVPRIAHQLHNIVTDSGCCSCPDLSLQVGSNGRVPLIQLIFTCPLGRSKTFRCSFCISR